MVNTWIIAALTLLGTALFRLSGALAQEASVIEPSGLQAEGTVFYLAGSKGYLIGAAHSVRHCGHPFVERSTGRLYPVELTQVDDANDFSLLHDPAAPAGDDGLPLAQRLSPALGETVLVYGFPYLIPLHGQGTLLVGNVVGFGGTQLGSSQFDPSIIRISMQLVAGFSGGPLVDTTGGVVGIASSVERFGSLSSASAASGNQLNFASGGEKLALFLDAAKVSYTQQANLTERPLTDIAAAIEKASVVLFCGL
jgi:S1-C subfamily serine protease